MKTFDAYEFVGVIAPGAVIAVGIFAQWPAAKDLVLSKEFSLGDFGIFIVCAFVLGHLVQAIGNIVELAFFAPAGGKPTNWLLRERFDLIAPGQRERVISAYSTLQGFPLSLGSTSVTQWQSITREIYSVVAAQGRAGRVDAFNRTYGLTRGIACALLLLVVWFLITRWGDWRWTIDTALLAALALMRMGHFAKLYARELFVQFIGCSGTTNSKTAAPDAD